MTDSKDFQEAINVRVTRNEEDIQDIWKVIEALKNRPPTWVTFAASATGVVIGSLLTLLTIMVKIQFG